MKYAGIGQKALMLGVVALVAAACSSKPKPEPDMKKVCPPKLVQAVLGNQQALTQIKRGETSLDSLRGLTKPEKLQRLGRYGEQDLVIALFPTAIPNCPYMLPGMTYTPVVLNAGDVVVGVGMDDLHDLFAKGWRAEGQEWPWQNYNYGYLPHK